MFKDKETLRCNSVRIVEDSNRETTDFPAISTANIVQIINVYKVDP